MYLAYWGLKSRPFDPAFVRALYYPAAPHQAALHRLCYVRENRLGAAALVGPPGVGKSLLVQLWLEQRAAQDVALVLRWPLFSGDDLLAWLAAELPGDGPAAALQSSELLRRVEHKLSALAAASRRVTLVVDDAHLITPAATWEAWRLLLNQADADGPLLTLCLVGQPALLTTLSRMPDWEQRLAVKCVLRGLAAEEAASYVQRRLQAAGAQRELFAQAALDRLHELSQGIPRRINRLADLALLGAYARELPQVSAECVDEAAADLLLSAAN